MTVTDLVILKENTGPMDMHFDSALRAWKYAAIRTIMLRSNYKVVYHRALLRADQRTAEERSAYAESVTAPERVALELAEVRDRALRDIVIHLRSRNATAKR